MTKLDYADQIERISRGVMAPTANANVIEALRELAGRLKAEAEPTPAATQEPPISTRATPLDSVPRFHETSDYDRSILDIKDGAKLATEGADRLAKHLALIRECHRKQLDRATRERDASDRNSVLAQEARNEAIDRLEAVEKERDEARAERDQAIARQDRREHVISMLVPQRDIATSELNLMRAERDALKAERDEAVAKLAKTEKTLDIFKNGFQCSNQESKTLFGYLKAEESKVVGLEKAVEELSGSLKRAEGERDALRAELDRIKADCPYSSPCGRPTS